MSLCGATGCGSNTADLKCARCQGVFYCDAACQKADWKRHKPFCKQLPSAAGSASTQLRRGRVSTSRVDRELFDAVHALIGRVIAFPKSTRKELAPVLTRVTALLGRGARPDVMVGATPSGAAGASTIAVLSERCAPGMEPLLELLLTAEYKPPLDLAAACEPTPLDLITPMYGAILSKRPSVVRLLVAHGADLTAPCSQDAVGRLFWPVYICVRGLRADLWFHRSIDGALTTLDYILSAGADAGAFDGRELADQHLQILPTPLFLPLIQLDLSPAHCAVMDAVAIKLINAGADVTVRNNAQMRPLDLAAMLPSLDIFKALLAKGADPSPTPFIADREVDESEDLVPAGTHYLQTAAENGRVDVLQAAADAGVNLKNARVLGAMASPLLAHSAYHGEFGCVRFLLEYGVDVNEVYDSVEGKLTACDHFVSRETGIEDTGRPGVMLALLRAAGGKRYCEL